MILDLRLIFDLPLADNIQEVIVYMISDIQNTFIREIQSVVRFQISDHVTLLAANNELMSTIPKSSFFSYFRCSYLNIDLTHIRYDSFIGTEATIRVPVR